MVAKSTRPVRIADVPPEILTKKLPNAIAALTRQSSFRVPLHLLPYVPDSRTWESGNSDKKVLGRDSNHLFIHYTLSIFCDTDNIKTQRPEVFLLLSVHSTPLESVKRAVA
jgi:hypothetical protein